MKVAMLGKWPEGILSGGVAVHPHSARVILNYNIFHTPSPSVKGSSWAPPLNLSPLLSLFP